MPFNLVPMKCITIRELYRYAQLNHMEDATIRICDGMAVSFYVSPICIGRAPCEIVIDVSPIVPIDYDDLSDVSKRVVFGDSSAFY